MTSKTKQASLPFCSCGCGERTKGGTFKMGHDQRLRGILTRDEKLEGAAISFMKAQPKTSEWRRLQREGTKRAAERAERDEARVAAKAAREAEKAAAKKEAAARKQHKADHARRPRQPKARKPRGKSETQAQQAPSAPVQP